MSNFPENKFLATSKATNKQNTFLKPTPEGSPVLTLGIYYKGQGRTRLNLAHTQNFSFLGSVEVV